MIAAMGRLGMVCLAIVGLWAGAATAADDKPSPAATAISTEEFSRQPFIREPELSPSGQMFAAQYWQDGRHLLGVYALEGDQAGTVKVAPLPAGQVLHWYQWASDRYVVASVGRDLGYSGRLWRPPGRLHLYEVASNQLRPLGDGQKGLFGSAVIHVAPDGSHLLVAWPNWTMSPSVYRVELPGGKLSRVVARRPGIQGWIVDAEGRVRLGTGYRRNEVVAIYRGPEEKQFRSLMKVRFKGRMADVDRVILASDGTAYALSSTATGRITLFGFDPEEAVLDEPIFEHPRVDIDSLILDRNRRVAGVTYHDERPGTKWLRVEMQVIQDEVDQALPGRVNRLVSSNRDDSRRIVWTGSAADPGHYYLFKVADGVLNRIASPYEWLRGRTLSEVTPVSFPARDGLEIPGYLTLPTGRPPANLPAVVLVRSQPIGRDYWRYDPWVQFLASRGYAVLQVNFRGSGGYGEGFRKKGAGQIGRGMQTDLVDGVRWLGASGKVDPSRVCIIGPQFGGYAALMGVLQSPDTFRCAAAFSPITDMDPGRGSTGAYLSWEQRLALKELLAGEVKLDTRLISPVSFAEQLRQPVLLVYGESELKSKFSQASVMVSAVRSSKAPVEIHIVEGRSFFPTLPAVQKRAMDLVEAFLTRHNPAYPPPLSEP